MKNILITGGTGLIGRSLSKFLLSKGYKVSHLGRKENLFDPIPSYKWDIQQEYIDTIALEKADYIIHLAGANIFEKRWTTARRKEILESRVKGAELIFKKLKEMPHNISTFISASGIGYYEDLGDRVMGEKSPPGSDFLSRVCIEWEKAAKNFEGIGIRVVKCRMGVVLTRKGGALQELRTPLNFSLAPIIGDGKHLMPWIHIEDLCNIFLNAIEKENMSGVYNVIAPQLPDYETFMRILAEVMHKKPLFIHVPVFLLHIILGSRIEALTKSVNAAPKKLLSEGFEFKYDRLREALISLNISA